MSHLAASTQRGADAHVERRVRVTFALKPTVDHPRIRDLSDMKGAVAARSMS
jgi:hypothetical protein